MYSQDQVSIRSTPSKTVRLERSAAARVWPDDGLPARHRGRPAGSSLPPAVVLAGALAR